MEKRESESSIGEYDMTHSINNDGISAVKMSIKEKLS